MKKVILFLSFVSFALYSCEEEQISSQGQASSKGSKYMSSSVESGVVADLPPDHPEGGPVGGGEILTFTPAQSPAIFNAAPFVPSGQASSAFSSTGGLTTDIVSFGPAGAQDIFPFVPPTGAARVWMGFIFHNGPYRYVVRGYPIAISNGYSYWYGGGLISQLVGATIGTAASYTWVPSQVSSDNTIIPGHYDYTGTGAYNVTNAVVTITELSVNPQSRLTLRATVQIGGTIFQVNKTNYIRMVN